MAERGCMAAARRWRSGRPDAEWRTAAVELCLDGAWRRRMKSPRVRMLATGVGVAALRCENPESVEITAY